MPEHSPHSLTVIIPTLHAEPLLEAAIQSVRQAGDIEVIVAAAGDTQFAHQLATHYGVRVIDVEPGRGRQLNAAAAIATGDVLLFLHADTRLPSTFLSDIGEVLARPRVIGGAFQLGIDADGWRLRLIEWGVRQRCRWLKWPYGDQALFVRRADFEAIGGFPELPIMEDLTFVRLLKRRGSVGMTTSRVLTSARRWQKWGAFRVTLINQLMLLGYFLGVSLERLARFYRGSAKRGGDSEFQQRQG